jgi:hypothetical protein
MNASTEPRSLADQAVTVKKSLLQAVSLAKKLKAYPPETRASEVIDILERFTLWAGNLGALLSPQSKLSLDARLSDAPEIREWISEQLKDLQEAIDDCEKISSQLKYSLHIFLG